MTDYHATQLTGTRCAPYNCAAASGAMGIAFGTNYATRLTADQFRAETIRSCVPMDPPDGTHSRSGGLYISDVISVMHKHGVAVDYHEDANGAAQPWPQAELAHRCGTLKEGCLVLGDYGALPFQYRATHFTGDHSAFVHDYRSSDDTYHWHDPLRTSAMRLAASAVLSYWRGGDGNVKGLAGFVARPQPEEPMGLGVKITDRTPGTVTVTPAALRSIIRVRDRAFIKTPTGLSVAVTDYIGRGSLDVPLDHEAGDRSSVYEFNHAGEQHVSLVMDSKFAAAPDPAIATAYNAGLDAAAHAVTGVPRRAI